MSTLMTIQQAHTDWVNNIKPDIINEYGPDDEPALSEGWSNYTDALCQDGLLTELQYHYCPAHDEAMPDDDIVFLLDELGLSFEAVQVAERPDDLMADSATHWRCTFGPELVIYFSQGPAIHAEPEARDVLQCIISDADSVAGCANFEEFASDMGYDEDSRAAERIYEACLAQRESLLEVLDESQLGQFALMLEDD